MMNRLFPSAALLLLFLVACGGQQASPRLALVLTSAPASVSTNYTLTGVVEAASLSGVTAEYSLNDAEWQTISLGDDGSFAVTLTLATGGNELTVAAIPAGGNRVEKSLTVTVDASGGPQIYFSSPGFSTSSSYQLTGVALDDVAVTGLSYSIAGGDSTELAWDESGNFQVNLVLNDAVTSISVTAEDADGNSGNAHIEVAYTPELTDLEASAMAAERGATVTLTGSGFGPIPGTVSFDGLNADIGSWTDTEVTVTVPTDHPGGWTDLHVSSAGGNQVLEDFFVGIEVFDSNLNDFFAGMTPAAGTSLLLRGDSYELTQAANLPENYLLPYSFYGARTEGDPISTLSATAGFLLFSSSTQLALRFQDLNLNTSNLYLMEAQAAENGQGTSLDSSLTFENVRSTFKASEGHATGYFQSNQTILLGPDFADAPAKVAFLDSHFSGFETLAASGHAFEVQGSTFESVGLISLFAQNLPMSVSDSQVSEVTAAVLSGDDYVRFEDNEVDVALLLFVGNVSGASDSAPELLFRNNDVAGNNPPLAGGSTNLILGSNSQVSGNVFNSQEVNLTVGGSNIGVHDNLFTVDRKIDATIADGATLEFVDNTVVTPGYFALTGGASTVRDNSFDFSGAVETEATIRFQTTYSTAPNPLPLPMQVDFSDNQTVGGNKLFEMKSIRAAVMHVAISDNVFGAELILPGSVAELDGLNHQSGITATGNTWGSLTDLAVINSLVAYTASDPGLMVITD